MHSSACGTRSEPTGLEHGRGRKVSRTERTAEGAVELGFFDIVEAPAKSHRHRTLGPSFSLSILDLAECVGTNRGR
jgi:hypothetical protein